MLGSLLLLLLIRFVGGREGERAGGYFLIHSFCVIGVAISYFCFHFSEMITRTKKATTKQVRG